MKKRVKKTNLQKTIEEREKALRAKQEQLKAEAQELYALQRENVLTNVNAFGFDKDELDALLSVFSSYSHSKEIGTALVNDARTRPELINIDQFCTKLLRIGLL